MLPGLVAGLLTQIWAGHSGFEVSGLILGQQSSTKNACCLWDVLWTVILLVILWPMSEGLFLKGYLLDLQVQHSLCFFGVSRSIRCLLIFCLPWHSHTACSPSLALEADPELRRLSSRYLVGNQVTEADIKLFPTIFRLDAVYHLRFLLNKLMICDSRPQLQVRLGVKLLYCSLFCVGSLSYCCRKPGNNAKIC